MRQIVSMLFVFASLIAFQSLPAHAHGVEVGPLKIHHPWTRATPKGADVAGGFMSINNTGKTDDRLIGVTVNGIKRVEIHEMKIDQGMMQMRPLANGLVLPAGETTVLKPGGFHVMMMGLSTPFIEGDYIKATLIFEKAGPVDVEFAVEAQGAKPSPHDMTHTPQQ